MSALVCSGVSLAGAVLASWRGFKLLKRRERVYATIALCEDEEEEMNLRVEAQLGKKEIQDALRFWTVYALLMIFDTYVQPFISWVPFFYTFKLLLVLWVMVANGAGTVFEQVVSPQLDRHAEYIDGVLVPSVQSAGAKVQKAVASGFVGVAITVSSRAQLEDLQAHLEDMVDRIEEAKQAIARRELQGSPHRNYDDDAIRAAALRAQSSSSTLSSLSSSSSSSSSSSKLSATTGYLGGATTYLSSWWSRGPATEVKLPMDTNDDVGAEVDLRRAGDTITGDGRTSRSSSVGWVKNAFDGVVGLTVSTRDVLLGSAGHQGASNGEDNGVEEENKGEEECVNLHRGRDEGGAGASWSNSSPTSDGTADSSMSEREARDFLAKYSAGFDNLSDCDDSSEASASRSASFRSEMSAGSPRKAGMRRSDSLRRRRPVTRSQAKK